MTALLSVVLPCLNEANTLGRCLRIAQSTLERVSWDAEIIVADNGSHDGSQAIAEELGAKVINVSEQGYGNALKAGFSSCTGEYVFFADSDGSYDFSEIPSFVAALEQGYDLVVGNRFRGQILPGAMKPLHQYLGNPVLSLIGRLLFTSEVRDFHCGMRAFRRTAMERLDLQTGGMEFASEMIAKAAVEGLRLSELPIVLAPDGRGRPSHLQTWRDGWKHLCFMLQFALQSKLRQSGSLS